MLTKEVYENLFGDEVLSIKRMLRQPGEFASNQKISIKINDKLIENIRVVGPLRNYTQVELLQIDADFLNINLFERTSGELSGTQSLILIGPKGEIEVNECAIIANRHIHLSTELSKKLNLNNKQIVKVITEDGKIIDNVYIKTNENFEPELHINKDDAQNLGLENNQEVTIC